MSVSIELMANEKTSVFLNMAAVGVADIFEGGSPPVEFLAKRCGEMLRANPWLAGRLKTIDGQPHLVWDAESSTEAAAELFQVVDVASLPGVADVNAVVDAINLNTGPDTPPLAAPLEAMVCKAGSLSIDKDVPIVRIRLVTDGKGFCVMLTMSHSIGDGAVMYQFHAMLSNGAVPMDATRQNKNVIPSIKGHKDRIVGEHLFKEVTNAPQPTSTFGFGACYIDQNQIDAVKRAHVATPEAKFISTNDIVTSWFLATTKTDVGIMAWNTRKPCGVESTAAGNYIDTLAVDPQSMTPAGIRRIVNDTAPPLSLSPGPPRVGLVTNWTQHHTHIDLPGGCARAGSAARRPDTTSSLLDGVEGDAQLTFH